MSLMRDVIDQSRRLYEGVLISLYSDQEGNKIQRPNSGFIQRNPHETQYAS